VNHDPPRILHAERDLAPHLQGELLPVYLVTSADVEERGRNEERPTADPSALREVAGRIEAVALRGGDASVDRVHVDYLDGDHAGTGSIHALISQELRVMSLFGGRRVVTVLHADGLAFGDGEAKTRRAKKKVDDATDPLEAVLAGLDSASRRAPFVLILVAERFDRRKRAWKAIQQAGAVIEVAPLTVPALQSYLVATGRPFGITVDDAAAQRIWDRLGGADAARLRTTADRLLLDAGPGGKVTVARVDDTVPLDRDAAAWAVTDAIAEGDAVRALAVLHMVVDPADGFEEDVARFCGFLNGHYYLLAKAHALLASGRSESQVGEDLGVHWFRAKNLVRQVRSSKPGRIEAALQALDAAETMRKASAIGDRRAGVLRWVEQLVLALVHGTPLRVPQAGNVVNTLGAV
jgi:DNA polymerase III delta subunit